MDSKKKKNLEETYERILNVGFCIVPYEDISDIIGPDPMVYGTAKDERILSFEGVEALFKSQYEQMGNMKPGYERKRIALQISNGGNNACIIEELTFTLSSDEEIHTIFMRATCVMEYLENQWKLTHWHTSTPVDTENDPWHMEEWKREKEKLQQLVDEQTAALKQNNRELQIEAALEKIRSSSLAMQKTEDLREVVKVLFEQMQGLSVDMGFASVSIFIFEDGSRNIRQWLPLPDGVSSLSVPYFDHQISSDLFDAKESGEDFFTKIYTLEEKNTWLERGFEHTDYRDLPVEFKSSLLQAPGYAMAITLAKNSGICIPSFEGKLPTPENIQIMKRVGKVFEQAYIRFLDLQKAEAQAREAKIEAALERVRSRSLAMHHSSELSAVVDTLLREFTNLEFTLTFCIINLIDEKDMSNIVWAANPETGKDPESYYMKFEDYPFHHAMWDAWKAQKKRFVYTLEGEEKKIYDQYLYNDTEFRRFPKNVQKANKSLERYVAGFTFFKYSGLQTVSVNLISEDELEILERFGRVFEQAYTRFLDLQKAEAQAREAQIESALERVRSRTMAMHSSQDVDITVTTLFDELLKLGVDKSIRSGIGILDKSRRMEVWTASTNPSGQTALDKGVLDMGIHQLLTEVQEAWEAKKPTNSYELIGDDLIKYFKAINDAPGYSLQVDLEKLPGKITHYDFFFPEGFLFAFSPTPLSAEISRVFMRFASVFGQTYRRYLDLQKAEAQVREAQIEAALERVRSRSLAMHSSDEFVDASDVMVNQLKELGIDTLRIGIGIINKEDDSTEIWSKSEIEGKVKNTIIGIVPSGLHPIFDRTVDAWKKNESFYSSTRIGDEVKEYYQKLDAFLSYPERKEYNEREAMTAFFFPHGSLNVISLDPLKEEDCAIMTRFAKVFGQIYQRFRDLQKAEAQAREAQIEAALERVRSRTMAMHKSDELLEIGVLLFQELSKLGINIFNCGYVLMDDEAKIGWNYGVNPGDGSIRPLPTGIPQTGTKVLESITESWKKQEPLLLELDPQETTGHQTYMAENMLNFSLTKEQLLALTPERIAIHTFNFKHGYLLLVDGAKLTADQQEMAIRFAKVFEQTYTRFLDLQKAEAQAREATKQASLDRVRGIIASMRSATDLELITPLIFKELTILGVPFIRCGVFIIDEKQELVNAYLSSPMGNSLGVLRLHYNASVLTQGTVEAWRKGEIYRQHWNKEDFVQWINIMMQQDQIQDSRTYQGTAAPPESLNLHFVPFTQGMLYVGAISPLDEGELELVKSLAKAFSIAYARYEDFEKLDKAKSDIESALSELKATQSQLVQQEKLASLGQLTAGIAHEIKNPLNFVNNFSEVSMELIEEALEEIGQIEDNQHATESAEILYDIKSNLTKIHEHGTRANGIVSSMLQHSRGGSGKMEPTDLNALIKEYVNLSFHGMRAGKNSIDVDIILELDPEIKEVPLIKEDFTRVIINLCNNAFDAMRVKKYQDEKGKDIEYLPKLKVTTSLEKGLVRIAIQDNGPGIPDDIKDKILQPFFTTKKGTEGTGLGLSITNDIIKVLGGELTVNSTSGTGSIFIITLKP